MSPAAAAEARPRAAATRVVLRVVLALLYGVAGCFHLAKPDPFVGIMPGWVPWAHTVVFWTGVAELLGAVALAQPWSPPLRRSAGIAFAVYAICVFPANINHFALDLAKAGHGLGLAYHVPRMLAQPLLVWLAVWTSEATEWPFAPASRRGS